LDHSPKLFNRTMKDFETVVVNGQETGQCTLELGRVKVVMKALAHALAYRAFGRKFIGEWRVFCASLKSKTPTPEVDRIRELVASGAYET
jgi:hypothetical protein